MAEWDILNKDDIKKIQESYSKIEGRHQETGDYLYRHLFECCPDVADIFKVDMKEQSMILMRMVKTVVEGLNNVEIIMPAIQKMGQRHNDIGITPAQYGYFKESLLYALGKVLGKDFTPEIKESWSKFYDVLSGLMKGN